MSDVSMYELEDIVWTDFVGSDDHIVPGDEKRDGCVVNHKRLQCEVASGASSADNKVVAEHVGQIKEGTILCTLKGKQEKMLENGTRSHPSDIVFPASSDGDSNKKVSFSASDHNRTSGHHLQSSNIESIGIELCADNPTLGNQGESVQNSMYSYPLDAAPTNHDISFFGNDHGDHENSDLLYCGWPEMENFEDVDRMFRNSDSSFGVDICNEDDFNWFSASHAVESTDDAFDPNLKFLDPDPSALNVTEFHEAVRSIDTGQLTNDAVDKPTSINWTTDSQKVAGGDPPMDQSSFSNGSAISSVNENQPQVNLHENWSKHQKSSAREQKDLYLENGNSYIHLNKLNQIRQPRHPFKRSNHQSSSSSGIQKSLAKAAIQGNSIHDNASQSQFTFMSSNPGHPSQVSACLTASGVKSEANGLLYMLQKESCGSNRIQSAKSSHEISFQNPTVNEEEKKVAPYHRNGFPGLSLGIVRTDTASYDPISVQKQASLVESEVEDQSKFNHSGPAARVELDSSNLQESSDMSSVLDEVSLEARSFRQLQHVMEKLDIKTKHCIRDSLYRLAQSAEQRHKYANPTSGSGNNKDGTGVLTSDQTNKSAGFLDMETDTNPIDRSIAHLLFHRPSDTSATRGHKVVSVEPRAKVHASNNAHSTN